MAQLKRDGDFVGPGEKKAAAYLEENLPASWVVVCNKEVVNPDGSTVEVDFIIVGKHSVFAVEEKSWSGQIHGDENGWVLRSGESSRSPLNKIGYVARRLAGRLRKRVPSIKTHVRGHFVFERILMSSDNVELFVRDSRMNDQVHHLEGCEDKFKAHDRGQAGQSSVERHRDQIVSALTELRDRPKVPRSVGEYKIEETLSAYGPVRSLLARHADGSARILKLIEQPETAISALERDNTRALLREYEVLKDLGEVGVAPRVDPYFSFGDGRYRVVPIHRVEGASLRTNRADGRPSGDLLLEVMERAFETLELVHGKGVIHRSITPDRVILRGEESVVFTDFMVARVEGASSIADAGIELDPDHAYRAPECLVDLGLAVPASDTYSLAASLLYWAGGHECAIDADLQYAPFPRLDELRTDVRKDLLRDLSDVLADCLHEDERERPEPAAVRRRLNDLRPPETPVDTAEEIEPGAVLDGRYEIERILGRGGTAVTFLARDTVAERECVLKRIRDPEYVEHLARAEFRTLKDLFHPNLPRVYEIYSANKPFHLKLEYVRGSSLKDLWDAHSGKTASAIRIGGDVARALDYLSSNRLIHRDVSPGNILLPDEEEGAIKLIDFGMATAKDQATSVVGTPPYRPPEVEGGREWTSAGDQYSLGVVLFQLVTGRYPYESSSLGRRKDQVDPPTAQEEAEHGASLLKTLLRAASPDPSERFESAKAFGVALEASEQADADQPEDVEGVESVNPFVNELRQAYRNSRIGNRNNRGLEGEFSAETYVETGLDTELLPQILGGELRLVLLSGNPGDGKTAFLQRVEDVLRRDGGEVEHEDGSGWKIRIGERRFGALYDASASHKGRSADELLADTLHPLAGSSEPDVSYTALVAVNDGRMLDYFHRNGDLRYEWLWERLGAQVERSGEPADGVLLIDLKRRSLAGRTPTDVSLFRGILDHFTAEKYWAACDGCAAREQCPIRANAVAIGDTILGPSVRSRLHAMTLAAHWKRERRATIRDFRSAVSFLITHDVSCEEVHQERREGAWPLANADRLYFNAAFAGISGDDVLLETWHDLDPALVPAPRLDRYIHFHRTRDQLPAIRSLFLQPASRPSIPIPGETVERARRVGHIKRRLAFEGRGPTDEDATPDVLGGTDLSPYRHLDTFRRAVFGDTAETELRAHLLCSLSLADGVPSSAVGKGLSVRVGDPEGIDFVVIKSFRASEFSVHVPAETNALIEGVPDHLLLSHRRGDIRLEIDLDLWEYLSRAEEGFLMGPEEQRAIQEEIDVFKNRLLIHPASEAVLLEAGYKTHRVAVHDGVIVREEGGKA